MPGAGGGARLEKQMAKFKNYDEVKAQVAAASGVLTVPMSELRDVNGSGRLGPYVVEAISKQLAGRGIGHYPEDLPQNQWEKVRLFGLGSEIAELYKLVNDVTEEGDEKLRHFGHDDAKKQLDRIRQIVC